jgi:hypothetical protein
VMISTVQSTFAPRRFSGGTNAAAAASGPSVRRSNKADHHHGVRCRWNGVRTAQTVTAPLSKLFNTAGPCHYLSFPAKGCLDCLGMD